MKKILYLCLSNLLAFSSGAYPWQNRIQNLPPNVQYLATKTVGLTITKGNRISRCTGIRIESQIIATAAHCIRTFTKNKVLAEQISINFYGVAESVTLQLGTDYTLFYPEVQLADILTNTDAEKKMKAWVVNGADVAMIKLKHPPIPNEVYFKLLNDPVELVDYDKLSNLVFNSSNWLIGLGWGSHQFFQFHQVAVRKPDAQLMHASYDKLAINQVTDLINHLTNAQKIVTWSTKNIQAKANATAVPYFELRPEVENKISNTNILIIDSAWAESGDSGGPLLVCEAPPYTGPLEPSTFAQVYNCKFIGLAQGFLDHPELRSDTRYTTIVNPYFMQTYFDAQNHN